MLAPQVLLKIIAARLLPTPLADGPEAERFARGKKYGDIGVESVWPTDYAQADEGALFVASMTPGQAAIQLGISASFSAVAAAFALVNTDSPGPTAKRLYPKLLKLAASTVGTSGVDLRYAVVLDKANRTPSTVSSGTGGTGPGSAATATAYKAPAVNVNGDVPAQAGVGAAYFPLSTAGGAPPTVPAAGPDSRTLVGNGYIKNSVIVAKDQYALQFGKADVGGTFQGAAALAKIVEHAPALVVPPGGTMLIYLWSASNVTAGNAFDDASLEWVER